MGELTAIINKINDSLVKRQLKAEEQTKTMKATERVATFFCPVHGEYQTYAYYGAEPVDDGCPKCQEEQRILREKKYAIKIKAQKAYQELFAHCGGYVPCYADQRNTFDNFSCDTQEQTSHRSAAERFASRLIDRILTGKPEKSCIGLCLCGKTGAGKSHLASAIYNRLRKDELFPVYLRASAFFRLFRTDGLQETQLTEAFSRISCLLIDELGRSSNTSFETNKLLEILDERTRRGLPTVLVTNLGKAELKDGLGDAIASRARTTLFTLAFNGEDYRKRFVLPSDPLEIF